MFQKKVNKVKRESWCLQYWNNMEFNCKIYYNYIYTRIFSIPSSSLTNNPSIHLLFPLSFMFQFNDDCFTFIITKLNSCDQIKLKHTCQRFKQCVKKLWSQKYKAWSCKYFFGEKVEWVSIGYLSVSRNSSSAGFGLF